MQRTITNPILNDTVYLRSNLGRIQWSCHRVGSNSDAWRRKSSALPHHLCWNGVEKRLRSKYCA